MKKIMGISVVVAMVFLMFLVAGGISGEGEIEEESDKDNPNVEPVPSKTTHYIDRADITVKGNTDWEYDHDWEYTAEPEVEEPAEEKPVVQAPKEEEPKQEAPKEEPKQEEPAPAPSEPEPEEEEEAERPPGIIIVDPEDTPIGDFNNP